MNTIKLRQPAPAPSSSPLLRHCKTLQIQTPIISTINPSKQTTKIQSLSLRPFLSPLCSGFNPSATNSGDGDGDGGEVKEAKTLNGRDIVVRLGEALSLGFPVWVGSACLVALWRPPSFLWVGRNFQIVGLTLTMLGMGMTLTLEDLRAALLMPKQLAAGFVLQYTVIFLYYWFGGSVAGSLLFNYGKY